MSSKTARPHSDYAGWTHFLRKRRLFVAFLVFCITGLAYLGIWSYLISFAPTFINSVYYDRDASSMNAFDMPFDLSTGDRAADIDIITTLVLPKVEDLRYLVHADDCLQSLKINNVDVSDAGFPFCDFTKVEELPLADYLHKGANLIEARVHNNGGLAAFDLTLAPNQTLLVFSYLLLAVMPLLTIVCLLWLWKRPTSSYVWLGIFCLGLVLRVGYVLSTPYNVRSHDVDYHFQYVDYLAHHWNLPPIQDGWEYWQPPLYYYLASTVQRIGEWMGHGHTAVLRDLQWFAFALSVLTLVMCMKIARIVFPPKSSQAQWFALSSAVFPGIIYFAARINNDVLSLPLAILSILLLFKWWKTHRTGLLYMSILSIGLHILTKSTGYLFLPIILLCLFLHPQLPWKRKVFHGICCLAIIATFSYASILLRPTSSLVANVNSLNGGLNIPNSIEALTSFHPIQFLAIPYNDPWLDASRRQYFWEYFLRSAYLGEFDFGTERMLAAEWLLLSGMLMLPLLVCGLWISLRRHLYEDIPIFLLFATLLAGHVYFRLHYPYSSSQDFRYSPALLVPYFLLILRGLDARSRLYPTIVSFLFLLHTTLCALFLLSLWPGS